MGATAIREKLHDYIRIADDKKVKAIFTMIESDLYNYEWWKDKKFTENLDKEYSDYKAGKIKGTSIAELKKNIDALKIKSKKVK